jgi:hypothetical protein
MAVLINKLWLGAPDRPQFPNVGRLVILCRALLAVAESARTAHIGKRGTQIAMRVPDALPETRVAQDEYDLLQTAPTMPCVNRRKTGPIRAIQAKSCAAE